MPVVPYTGASTRPANPPLINGEIYRIIGIGNPEVNSVRVGQYFTRCMEHVVYLGGRAQGFDDRRRIERDGWAFVKVTLEEVHDAD